MQIDRQTHLRTEAALSRRAHHRVPSRLPLIAALAILVLGGTASARASAIDAAHRLSDVKRDHRLTATSALSPRPRPRPNPSRRSTSNQLPDPNMDRDRSPLDSIFAEYNHPDGPGASVAVIKRGEFVAQRAYGLADLEKKAKVTDHTNFRLASLTKQFTAMAVMILAEEQKLSLDDEITRYVPSLPAWAKEITIRQLLSHTSGVWAYEDFVPDSQTVQVKDRDVPVLLQKAESTYFKPGSAFRYSNSGYALLSLIVEKASKRGFADFLLDRVFHQAGMLKTVAFEDGVSKVSDRAFGYTKQGDGFARTDQSNTSAVLGDGGVYSSTYDLLWWIRSIEDMVLVHAESQLMAWTPATLNSGAATSYGFGWFISTEGGDTHYWHNGETRGFTNGIVYYPKRRLAVIVLTNRTGGEPWKLAERVARLPNFK